MKRIQFLLLAIILVAIAGKVNNTQMHSQDYAALSTDTKLEDIEQFFQYKVNHIQSKDPYTVKTCTTETAVCCHI